MKEQKIKALLDKFANEQNANLWLYESKKVDLARKLANLTNANIEKVKKIIESDRIVIRESVDFSSTSYLLAQIAQIINED